MFQILNALSFVFYSLLFYSLFYFILENPTLLSAHRFVVIYIFGIQM